MTARLHLRRIALRRKLQILRSLAKSKSVKTGTIIKDAFFYISKLRLQIEAIKQDCQCLINHIQEVQVEEVGTGGYLRVRVTSKKGKELLVPILEAFEDMNLNVVQARVDCHSFFGMEAIVQTNTDATLLSEAVLKVVKNHTQR